MIYVLTPEQIRAVDAAAVERVGTSKLMRNAGRRIARRLRAMAKPGSRIVAFAGPGNNGGDAFAAIGELAREYDCTVAADPAAQGSQARDTARARAKKAGVTIVPLPAGEREARALLENAVGVDGLFGTGARLPLPEEYRHLARALDARESAVLAIDIPSGTDALTGAVSDDAVRATLTVTLAAAKPGLLLEPAREYVGELWCAEIGIDEALLAAQPRTFATLDNAEFIKLLPRRAADTEKRAAGAPLIVAGSAQFPGAAVLCA
ncbi:MAG: NAD(P)H-hydrate epimerase, partial [Candidatus Cybelea sp.]